MVKSYVTNPLVTKYFKEDIEAQKVTLVETISSLRPYASHLASELYRNSNVGLVLQYTALFDNNRTILQMAQQCDEGDMLTKVRSLEKDYKEKVYGMLKNPRHSQRLTGKMLLDECPTKTARDLRTECFQCEVHGGTNAVPVDQLVIDVSNKVSPDERSRSILVTLSDDLMEGKRPHDLNYGPFRAYLGSKTVEKVVKSQSIEIQRTKTTEAAKRLTTLETWARRVGGQNLINLIRQLIDEKGIDVSGMAPVVTRGNIFHRLSTPLDSSGCIINTPLHLMTHIRFSTSGMTHYQLNEADWTIVFQSNFQYLGVFLVQCAQYVKMPRLVYGRFDCPECTVPVPEVVIDITSPYVSGIPGPIGSPLLPATIPDTKALSFAVGAKLADSLRKFSVTSTGDINDMFEERQMPITNSINLSDFRRCNLIEVATSLVVRSPYMIYWCKKYKKDQHGGLLPNVLYTFADCILRTGRLEEIVELLDMNISYESSKKTSALAKQLFFSIVRLALNHNPKFFTKVGYYFDEEVEWFPRRLVQVESVLEIPSLETHCLGSKADVGLAPGPVSYVPPRTCQAMLHGVERRGDCISFERRVVAIPSWVELPSPLYHLARGMGSGSSAASKYYMILCEDEMQHLSPDLVVSLADGCGGTLCLLMHLFPEALGFFNTLMDKDILQLLEPTMLIPSALVKCGLPSRIKNLTESILGPTDITLPETQDHIIKLLNDKDLTKELLLTMDAESSGPIDWKVLLTSTLVIFQRVIAVKKTAIIKLLVPEHELTQANGFVMAEMLSANYKYMWVKPCSSMAYNHEFFLVVGDFVTQNTDTPASLLTRAREYSVRPHLEDYLDLGLKLKNVMSCMNIADQNLLELTELEPSTLTPVSLLRRIKNLLRASWEELEKDDFYLEMIRVRGRSEALLQMVMPLVLIHVFWAAGPKSLCRVFLRLKSQMALVQHKSEVAVGAHHWPLSTPYGITIVPSTAEVTILSQCKRSMKKILRATLAVIERPKPSKYAIHSYFLSAIE